MIGTMPENIGPAGLTALINDIISTNGTYVEIPKGCQSCSIQIDFNGAYTAGAITFEGCNNLAPNRWKALQLRDHSNATSTSVSTASPASSSSQILVGNIPYRFIRFRISTAFTGGVTVQGTLALFPFAVETPLATPSADSAARRIYTQLTDGSVSPSMSAASSALAASAPALAIQQSPNRYAQATMFSLLAAASTNATLVKASAGSLTSLLITNLSAAVRYVKLYNLAVAPTVGSSVPVLTIPVAAGATFSLSLSDMGQRFSTGISYAITTGLATTDTGACAAGDVQILGSYI